MDKNNLTFTFLLSIIYADIFTSCRMNYFLNQFRFFEKKFTNAGGLCGGCLKGVFFYRDENFNVSRIKFLVYRDKKIRISR